MEKRIRKSYDPVDNITDEEYAKVYIRVWAEECEGEERGTLEEVDDAWEDIKRGAERHGFPITPALLDAYTEARTEVQAMAKDKMPVL